MKFVIPPGRNATLRDAWEKLYGAPKKAKPEPTPEPSKKPKQPAKGKKGKA